MRFMGLPQRQFVLAGSWRTSRRGRCAGSAWRLGLCLSAVLRARLHLLDLCGHGSQIGV